MTLIYGIKPLVLIKLMFGLSPKGEKRNKLVWNLFRGSTKVPGFLFLFRGTRSQRPARPSQPPTSLYPIPIRSCSMVNDVCSARLVGLSTNRPSPHLPLYLALSPGEYPALISTAAGCQGSVWPKVYLQAAGSSPPSGRQLRLPSSSGRGAGSGVAAC